MKVTDLPTLNAILNLCATCLLIWGRMAIKSDQQEKHKKLMGGALFMSALFLTSYLYYHFNVQMVTRYQGEGILRGIYFFILLTHIPLAGLIVPFILAAVWYARKGDFVKHVRITRWLWPTWLYVSVTGILIYIMLYLL